MDIERVKRLRRSLTLHFTVLAWLTAMLVASGSESYFLPIFIFCVGSAAFVFVDTLEWFEVGRWGSYFLMTAATGIAFFNYMYYAFQAPSESGQLMAVASLLVFPEAVLFLQRKNLRIFEQLAVFLLLEMIVAALVNDNIVFGLLLAPIMLLWVSSLFLFARYATLVHVDPSIESPIPHLAELIYKWLRRKSNKKPAPSIESKIVTGRNVQGSRLLRRLLQSAPIGVGAIAFSGFFIYLSPRASSGSLRRPAGDEIQIGIPNELTLGIVGKLKADPSPVMRVTLRSELTRDEYALEEPPYLRARVLDTYRSPSESRFGGPSRSGGQGRWMFGGAHEHRRLPNIDSVRHLQESGRDLVRVEFDIRRRYLPTLCSVNSVYETPAEPRFNLRYDKHGSTIKELSADDAPTGKSVVYEIGSAAFVRGKQLPVIPVNAVDNRREYVAFFKNDLLLDDVTDNFPGTREYTQGVLSRGNCPADQKLRAAKLIENHFVASGAFQYSLDLTLPDNSQMDPIEDFVVNKRTGHCQYFASSMVVMLRQLDIRCRLVVGYHPREFNGRGRYFAVRQSDAHTWVEALLTREDLLGTEYARWLTDAEEYWVRFDPTPAFDELGNEIVDQPGQTLDFAEKLWKDYIVDGQKLAGENSLYAPVAENSKSAIAQLSKNAQELFDRLRATGLSSLDSFGLPAAIAVLLLFLICLAVWRLIHLLPRFAPRLARRLGVGPKQQSFQQAFFARCVSLLESIGVRRQNSQTPQEFMQGAAQYVEPGLDANDNGLSKSLGILTSHYYRQRFGAEAASREAEVEIQYALAEVEAAVQRKQQ